MYNWGFIIEIKGRSSQIELQSDGLVCTFLSRLRADTSKFATRVSVISSAQIC